MSKSSGNESALSSKAKAAIKDLNSLEGRYGTYVSSIDRGVEVGTFTNDEVVARRHDSCLSVIDGLGADELRNHLTPEQKEELINSFRETTSAISETLQDAKEKEKLDINTAKMEASLKGFELPLALGGRSDQIKSHGLNMKEHYPKIIKATQEALVELAGKGIPHEEYAEKLQESILKKVQNEFSAEQLESVEKIIAQGKQLRDAEKPLEKQKFQSTDLKRLQDAAANVSNQFQKILSENKKDANIINVIQKTTRNIEEDHSLKTTKARERKILKNLSPALSQLDPEYLEKYNDIIAGQLTEDLKAQGTYMGRMRGELRVSEANRKNIANNLLKNHLAASEKFAMDKITGELFKQQLTNTQIADRLNEFSKASGVEKAYNTSNIPSDKELVQMRKENQQLFDKLVLKTGPEKATPSAEIQKPKKEVASQIVSPKKPEIITPPPFLSESNPISQSVQSQPAKQTPSKPVPPAKPKISNEVVKSTIKALRGDFTGIVGFISGEFVKIAKANKGVIDVNHHSFVTAADSLINTDPRVINSKENLKKRGGRNLAVLSFTGTKQGIEGKIDKLISKGADPKEFTSIRQDLAKLETTLKQQVSSTEGIKGLVAKKMSNDLLAYQTNLLVHDKDGNLQGMPMTPKKQLIADINEHISISDSAFSSLMSDDKNVQDLVNKTTNRLICETLGKKEKRFYVFDKSKLSEENITKLGQSIGDAISNASLVHGVAQSIEQESGLKINETRRTKILKNIAPSLGKLDPEYLEQYKDIIAADLAKDLQSQGSTWGRINGELRTSTKSQQNIANKILDRHLASSEKFAENKITGEFYKQQLTNTQMADRLNEFSKANGSEQVFKASKIPSDKDLVQMRKASPKLFDKLVLNAKPKTTPKIPDDVRKKLSGNMKVSASKKATVTPNIHSKTSRASRGM